METRTVICEELGKPVVGSMINSCFARENVEKIVNIQNKLQQQFPQIIWNTPPESLHITLMDWIAPLVDYGEDKQDLFQKLFPKYNSVLEEILSKEYTINVHFSELRVTPKAVILVGTDNGSFQRIRDTFMEEIDLTPGTKLPPTIIHSSLARYKAESDLKPIEYAITQLELSFYQTVSEFRLVHETVASMIQFEIIKTYKLNEPI